MRLLNMNFKLIHQNLQYLAFTAIEACKESYYRMHQNQYQSNDHEKNSVNYNHHYRVEVECLSDNTEFYFDLHTNEPGKLVNFICDCCGESGTLQIPTNIYSDVDVGFNHKLHIVKT